MKQPALLYKIDNKFYLQYEVDEFGHPREKCFDEDTRLVIIGADMELPGYVIRIDPDHPPCLREYTTADGEKMWEPVKNNFRRLFDDHLIPFIRKILVGGPPDKIERYFFTADGQVDKFRAKD